jgi:hypothetical protein
LKTGKINRSKQPDDGSYPSYRSAKEAYENGCMFGAAGYATIEDDEVYAESVVSCEDADRLVKEKCAERIVLFSKALAKFG